MKGTATSALTSVLVIEDDQSVARMLRFSLRDAGFQVALASTGGDALKVLEQQRLDAVILDLGLPDGLGASVLARLRQWERHGSDRRPAWVVITAQDRDEVAKNYGHLGNRLVLKPFDPWDLVRLLQGLIAAR